MHKALDEALLNKRRNQATNSLIRRSLRINQGLPCRLRDSGV
jgi:hypothetical protein